jgi:hypothetical protein
VASLRRRCFICTAETGGRWRWRGGKGARACEGAICARAARAAAVAAAWRGLAAIARPVPGARSDHMLSPAKPLRRPEERYAAMRGRAFIVDTNSVNKQANPQASKQASKQASRQAGKQASRQASRKGWGQKGSQGRQTKEHNIGGQHGCPLVGVQGVLPLRSALASRS